MLWEAMCLFCSLQGDIPGYGLQFVKLIPLWNIFLYDLSIMANRPYYTLKTIQADIAALRLDIHLACHLVQCTVTIVKDNIYSAECTIYCYVAACAKYLHIEVGWDLNSKGYRDYLMCTEFVVWMNETGIKFGCYPERRTFFCDVY